MDEQDLRIAYAVQHTQVVRRPRQALATFGSTIIHYYLVTQPAYAHTGLPTGADESVVREGKVTSERPQVVTPYYLSRTEGFGEHTSRYLQRLIQEYGPHAPGLLYAYRNEGQGMSIVSGRPPEVAARIRERLDKEDQQLDAVIQGVDEMWDVSLLKFIYDLTTASARSNASELQAQGMLEMEGGVPQAARQNIERLLEEARRGHVDPSVVKRELDRWDLFEKYQDRFFSLFRRR